MHWDEVVKQLGCEYLRRHDLRHTGLMWTADADVPAPSVALTSTHNERKRSLRVVHDDRLSSFCEGKRWR
jgi:hypothetical protein